MLSVAKHLLYLSLKTDEKQIPRFAWDDMIGGLFSSLLG